MSSSKDLAFLSKGFYTWKDATEEFCRHEKSDVGEFLSTIHAQEKADNQRVMLKILNTVQYFSRQESESNFHQLLDLLKHRDSALAKWLGRKGDRS